MKVSLQKNTAILILFTQFPQQSTHSPLLCDVNRDRMIPQCLPLLWESEPSPAPFPGCRHYVCITLKSAE